MTPALAMRKRWMFQFPVEMERVIPVVMESLWCWRQVRASNWEVRLGFLVPSSMRPFNSVLNFLKRSSNKRARSWPALTG